MANGIPGIPPNMRKVYLRSRRWRSPRSARRGDAAERVRTDGFEEM